LLILCKSDNSIEVDKIKSENTIKFGTNQSQNRLQNKSNLENENEILEQKNEKQQMKRPVPGSEQMSDAYAFGGMHCIFTHHTQAGLFDSI
jgi:hypothetical protein